MVKCVQKLKISAFFAFGHAPVIFVGAFRVWDTDLVRVEAYESTEKSEFFRGKASDAGFWERIDCLTR